MFEALRWYVVLQVFGIAVLPLALHFFRFLPDRGYAFARPLGLLLVGYLLWIGGVFGLLENSPSTILLLLLIVAGVTWTVFRSQTAHLRDLWRNNRGHILAIEGIFLVSFGLWVVIRAYNPEIQATEKPMEFAFLNATLRSTHLPPLDPWLSGYTISYYYFGYLFIAMITSLTQVPSAIAFNLAIPTIFALTATGAYSIGYNLAEGTIRGSNDSVDGHTRPKKIIGPWFAGACTVFTMLILSNWEVFLELLHSSGVGAASFWKSVGIHNLSRPYDSGQFFPLDSQDNWWWFRASRVIGDYNSQDGRALDYTINEFPFFSFILGDVHPHVLALPFVLLTVGYSLNLLRSNAPLTAGGLRRNPLDLAFVAILFGGLWVLNAWDMPTQLFVLAVTVAVGHSIRSPATRSNWVHEALLVISFPFFAIAWAIVLFTKVIRLLLSRPAKIVGLLLSRLKSLSNMPTNRPAKIVGPLSSRLKSSSNRLSISLAQDSFEKWLNARVVTTFLIVLVACVVAYAPFILAFRTQASGTGLVLLSTQWHHFLIFWGPLFFFGGSLLVTQMATGLGGAPMLHRPAGIALRDIAASDWKRQWWIWPAIAGMGLLLAAVLEAAASLGPLLGRDVPVTLPGDALERVMRRALLLSFLLLALTAIITRIWRLTVSQVPADPRRDRPAAVPQTQAISHQELPSNPTDVPNTPEIAGGTPIASLAREHTFVLILLFTGILLIFGTEIAFVRDFFNNRMNTVFKLYYQAWTLMAIVAGYTIYYFAGFARARQISIKPIVTHSWLVLAIIVVAGGLVYPVGATLSKTGYFKRTATLNGFVWYEQLRPGDYHAIKWLNENVEGSPVILEASGGSYSAFGRVSAYTGLPTLLGWEFHEMQWRGSVAEQAERKGDIDILFQTSDPGETTELMSKYRIEYVYVGPLERRLYGDDGGFGLEKFPYLMDIVYDRDGVTIYRLRGPAT